jgi:hypothetical protein
MDFMEGLLKSEGKDVIMVEMDCLANMLIE